MNDLVGFIGLGTLGRAVAAVKELFALAFTRGLEEQDVSVIFSILREGVAPPRP